MAGASDLPGLARPELARVLESAARLQAVVPDAVLVGGSAEALWANHRSSHDHDHVLQDLSARFDAVLEAVESTDGWVTNRVNPGKIILGELGDIESGVRQLIRNRPLEVTEVTLPSGHTLRVPTPDEILRIKGYLVVRRNQVRTIWTSPRLLTALASRTPPTSSATSTFTTLISADQGQRASRPSWPVSWPIPGQRT
jgi:hypothetical protein